MDNYFRFGNGKRVGIIIPGISLKSVLGMKEAIIKQYSMFSMDYTFYLIDRDVMRDGYTIEDMCDDVIRTIEELKLKDLYVIATSQGGMIAQCLAIKRSDLVKAMALLSTTYIVDEQCYKLFNSWISLAEQNNIKELIDTFSRDVYSESFYNKYKALFLSMADSVTREDIKRFIIMCKAMKGFNIEKSLKNIKSENIVIGSSRDKIFNISIQKSLISLIGCQSYIYNDYSHAVYDEDPMCIKRVLEFFNKK